ncbi:unnamed protein product [Echinostoma caproni]|uniref:BAR domain-containing protein n=1 Tax=Echinostoma caproni TaxID=27848 RepID=A0A183AP13_9TREM|nr:unnamed protein product [Echinostoma caproni]
MHPALCTLPHHQPRHFLEAESRLNNTGPITAGLNLADRYRQVQTQRFAEAAYASADYHVARVCTEVTTETSPILSGFNQRRQDTLGKELRERWEKAVTNVSRFYAYETVDRRSIAKRAAAVKEFSEETAQINRLIDRYNLIVPALHLQRGHKNAEHVIQKLRTTRPKDRKSQFSSDTLPPSKPQPPSESDDPAEEAKKQVKGSQKQNSDEESNSGNLFDARYLAEIMRDFYRELARAYASMMRGFKNHR